MDNALFDKAVKMSPTERVMFAELLLESIDYEDEKIKEAWLVEVKERMKAAKNGEARLVDLEQIL